VLNPRLEEEETAAAEEEQQELNSNKNNKMLLQPLRRNQLCISSVVQVVAAVLCWSYKLCGGGSAVLRLDSSLHLCVSPLRAEIGDGRQW
jgi:hypothetical protein